MKKAFVIIAILLTGVLFNSFIGKQSAIISKKTPEDSLAIERGKFITAILDSLNGKETMAADSVFKNIQTFKSSQRVQVRHLMAIMNYWGEALGVNCTYCQTPANWAQDSLRTKRIARDMYNMRLTINNEILAKINDLASKPARVNCTTCHNGKIIPRR